MTDPENQPNQFGVEFLMRGPKFAFKVGVQQFTLDYEPEEPGEFEFMRDALIHAFSTFTSGVKAEQPAEPVEFLQFLTDVVTAAGLLSHGKTDKALAARISDFAIHLRTAPQPAKPAKPAEQEPVALGPLAKRRVFDYIRGAYDLGYNDARNARTIPGDNAPGYKGRDVEADHGGALFNALRACITAPHPTMHPFLVRDLAELIGSTAPDVCNALEDMGIEPRRSTNAAVTPDEALAVARRLAQPAKRVPLTDEEIDAIFTKVASTQEVYDMEAIRKGIARAIERAHGIKE